MFNKDFVVRHRVQQGFRGQTAKTPDISLAEKTVEMPDTRTQDKKQLVNTHVQHVVDTVEVEKPKLVKETVQRKKPIIQEKINQVTKHVEGSTGASHGGDSRDPTGAVLEQGW